MGQPVLLKAVQERLWDVAQVRFLHHNKALKVCVDTTRLDVGTDGNVGKVAWPRVGIDAVEATVEEVIEALMDAVSLAHDDRVTFSGGVADGSNCVDL